MKKSFNIIMALTAMIGVLAFIGQVHAYQVIGDVLNPGTYSSGGSLWSVLNTAIIRVNATPANPSGTENWIEGDYVQVTGANGATALYSVGELNPLYGNAQVSLTSNGSGGYTLSGVGRSVTNVTGINVVHTIDPVKGGPWIYANSFSVSNGGAVLDTFSLSGSGGLVDTAGKVPASTVYYGGSSHAWNYTGVTLLGMLQGLGINTSNLNQYVIVKATDAYATVLSMGELVNGEAAYIGYKGDPADSATAVGPEVVVSGQVVAGYDGFARLMFPDEASGIWVSRISGIDVEAAPIPLPATLFLLAPGLAGLAAIRRRFKS